MAATRYFFLITIAHLQSSEKITKQFLYHEQNDDQSCEN
jgi:hypothetical protein